MFQYTYALQVLLGARGEISCIYIIIDEGFYEKSNNKFAVSFINSIIMVLCW